MDWIFGEKSNIGLSCPSTPTRARPISDLLIAIVKGQLNKVQINWMIILRLLLHLNQKESDDFTIWKNSEDPQCRKKFLCICWIPKAV